MADTLNIGPGHRYDVVWKARKPGVWMIHCHISHHTTNNNTDIDGGGIDDAHQGGRRSDDMNLDLDVSPRSR